MLHPDGFVVYRVHRDVRTARIQELTAAAGRIRGADPGLLSRLDAAFATEVPAELGFGF
jgi:predicted acetyltransferase